MTLQTCVCQKLSAGVYGGLTKVLRVGRHKSKAPHQRQHLHVFIWGSSPFLLRLYDSSSISSFLLAVVFSPPSGATKLQHLPRILLLWLRAVGNTGHSLMGFIDHLPSPASIGSFWVHWSITKPSIAQSEAWGAHTKLGTVIWFFIPASIHLYTDLPAGELLWTTQLMIWGYSK